MLSGQNESHLHWSGTFLTWLLYCSATLIISAIAFSPALSITGTLKKTLYRKGEPHKPKFLAKQRQDSSIAAIPRS